MAVYVWLALGGPNDLTNVPLWWKTCILPASSRTTMRPSGATATAFGLDSAAGGEPASVMLRAVVPFRM